MNSEKQRIEAVDCTISNKTNLSSSKPCKSYIEITFKEENNHFNYIIFQNFYTYQVSVKQFIKNPKAGASKDDKKVEANWVTVLKDYRLMKNAHFESDAQNWHIIGSELVSSLFDISSV